MQARRAARELALILFSQMDIVPDIDKLDFQDLVVKSVRTLTNSSIDELNNSADSIMEIKEYINEYEANHPDNMARPIGISDKPVPMPTTEDMRNKLDDLLNIADKIMLALEIAEMSALEENHEVKEYIKKLTEEYKKHKNEIDEQIKKYSIGWDFNRLVNMDKDILRISICELLFVKDVPVKVVIDEAVELAKKYSTDDSSSFVNGILGKVVLENNLK
jgi:N utilization substance protein B